MFFIENLSRMLEYIHNVRNNIERISRRKHYDFELIENFIRCKGYPKSISWREENTYFRRGTYAQINFLYNTILSVTCFYKIYVLHKAIRLLKTLFPSHLKSKRFNKYKYKYACMYAHKCINRINQLKCLFVDAEKLNHSVTIIILPWSQCYLVSINQFSKYYDGNLLQAEGQTFHYWAFNTVPLLGLVRASGR